MPNIVVKIYLNSSGLSLYDRHLVARLPRPGKCRLPQVRLQTTFVFWAKPQLQVWILAMHKKASTSCSFFACLLQFGIKFKSRARCVVCSIHIVEIHYFMPVIVLLVNFAIFNSVNISLIHFSRIITQY